MTNLQFQKTGTQSCLQQSLVCFRSLIRVPLCHQLSQLSFYCRWRMLCGFYYIRRRSSFSLASLSLWWWYLPPLLTYTWLRFFWQYICCSFILFYHLRIINFLNKKETTTLYVDAFLARYFEVAECKNKSKSYLYGNITQLLLQQCYTCLPHYSSSILFF